MFSKIYHNGRPHRVAPTLLVLIFYFLSTGTIHAQDLTRHTWEVYVQRNIGNSGDDLLLFVDLLTGANNTARVRGERYTTLGNYVLYYDPSTLNVMVARTDGTLQAHPFIQLGTARRVDWIVSDDQRRIAWTLTYGDSDALRTVTEVANPDGAERRIVLENGFRNDGVRALPVAFTNANSALIMDAHPDIITTPYPQYARLFRLELSDSSIDLLPDEEQACFCAAGLRAGQFLRLAITADLRGFNVRVYDLLNPPDMEIISALRLNNYTQAGDILIAPDGQQALYALSQIENFGSANQTVNTVLMLVDLNRMTQSQITPEPLTSYLHPVRWTEDNSAVLYTSPSQNGTWKVRVSDGELSQVATATYIGTVQN